ncbi:WbqC family protein [Pseudomonas sp. 5P_5.1_Bac1]|uniref:WbqC family protein n=1 Tax=Pseudomonas sp. 5P_5.1_Bac1 TaxID=2971616 RepID=UPI0021C769F4|nr:WbqC family protein [Pseudomonas sp. 5P_5.1_Bac1]MCU1722456.1 WbqC family protein [Pseudomonas sp. 5P_5.1_Bac1]
MTAVAIMQPYLFPYIGYWQLLHASDCFVVYDDVNYINRGWINRNRILINNEPGLITLPLLQASQNRKIRDIEIAPHVQWQRRLLRTLEMTYRKAPCFDQVFPLLEQILGHDERNLAAFLSHQLHTLARFMGLQTRIVTSSAAYRNDDLAAQERILDICRQERATQYINAQGGRALYEPAAFAEQGIDLRFIAMRPLPYRQRGEGFTPYLSIVDALMEVGPDGIGSHLAAYDL